MLHFLPPGIAATKYLNIQYGVIKIRRVTNVGASLCFSLTSRFTSSFLRLSFGGPYIILLSSFWAIDSALAVPFGPVDPLTKQEAWVTGKTLNLVGHNRHKLVSIGGREQLTKMILPFSPLKIV
jgi:hypothetical protein